MKLAGDRMTVSTDTLVHRVLFDGQRAVGIEYQQQGQAVQRAYANKEVSILSGS